MDDLSQLLFTDAGDEERDRAKVFLLQISVREEGRDVCLQYSVREAETLSLFRLRPGEHLNVVRGRAATHSLHQAALDCGVEQNARLNGLHGRSVICDECLGCLASRE